MEKIRGEKTELTEEASRWYNKMKEWTDHQCLICETFVAHREDSIRVHLDQECVEGHTIPLQTYFEEYVKALGQD